MRTSLRSPFAAFLAVLVLMVGAVALAGPAASAADACANTWGSLDKAGGGLSGGDLFTARTGRHDCYDSLVFEFDGPANGYRVGYTGEVYSEGRGLPLSPGAGNYGALIGIHLLEPAYGYPPASTPTVAGYQTFRGVVFGGTFEGYTTFALGVRARLPFQVLVLPGPGPHTRIVVNVAHRWAS
jgi:hypothetical protein